MRWNPLVPVLCCVVLTALAVGSAAGNVAQTDALQDPEGEEAPPPHAENGEAPPPPHAENDDTDGDPVDGNGPPNDHGPVAGEPADDENGATETVAKGDDGAAGSDGEPPGSADGDPEDVLGAGEPSDGTETDVEGNSSNDPPSADPPDPPDGADQPDASDPPDPPDGADETDTSDDADETDTSDGSVSIGDSVDEVSDDPPQTDEGTADPEEDTPSESDNATVGAGSTEDAPSTPAEEPDANQTDTVGETGAETTESADEVAENTTDVTRDVVDRPLDPTNESDEERAESVDDTTDTAADAVDDTTDTAADGTVDETTDSADDAVDDTADAVEDTGTDTTDVVDDTVSETGETVDETGNTTTGAADETTDVVDETVDGTTDTVDETVDGTTDVTATTTDDGTDPAGDATGSASGTWVLDAVRAGAGADGGAVDTIEDSGDGAVATVDDAVDEGSVDDGASATTESELATLASIAESTAGVTATTLTAGENGSVLVSDRPVEGDGEPDDDESGAATETSDPGASDGDDGGSVTADGTTVATGTNATDGESDPAAGNATPTDGDDGDDGGGNSTGGAGTHRQHEEAQSELPDGLLDGGSSEGLDGDGAAVAGIALVTMLSAGLLNRSSEAAVTMGASGPTSLWVQVKTLWATLEARLARLPELLPIPGYERWDDTDPLEHETRSRLYEEITDHHVVNVATLVERTGLSRSTARHHLRILEHEGVVRSTRVQGKRCFYDDEQIDLAPLAALTDETRTDLLRELRRCEGASGTELADRLGLDPSTVSYHLERLAEAGLVERERVGRSISNRLTESARDAVADVVPAPEGRDADPSDE